MNHPLVSVIIPVYNGEATIARCVESLLAQDHPQERYEILIIDNGSKDASGEIVRRYAVKLLSETTVQSAYAARNRGIEASRGEFLAFTDSDCVADGQWINQLLRGFTAPEIGGVAGRVEVVATENVVSRYQKKMRVHDQESYIQGAFHLPFAALGNVMFRRSVFDQVGLFDEAFYSGGDVEFGWRMNLLTTFSFVYQPQAVVEHNHCRTIRGHYKQFKRYATGHVHLAKKYRHIGPKRSSLRQLAWTYREIFRQFRTAALAWVAVRKTDGDPMLYMGNLLDAITSLAYQVGYLQGSIKYRYWYM